MAIISKGVLLTYLEQVVDQVGLDSVKKLLHRKAWTALTNALKKWVGENKITEDKLSSLEGEEKQEVENYLSEIKKDIKEEDDRAAAAATDDTAAAATAATAATATADDTDNNDVTTEDTANATAKDTSNATGIANASSAIDVYGSLAKETRQHLIVMLKHCKELGVTGQAAADIMSQTLKSAEKLTLHFNSVVAYDTMLKIFSSATEKGASEDKALELAMTSLANNISQSGTRGCALTDKGRSINGEEKKEDANRNDLGNVGGVVNLTDDNADDDGVNVEDDEVRVLKETQQGLEDKNKGLEKENKGLEDREQDLADGVASKRASGDEVEQSNKQKLEQLRKATTTPTEKQDEDNTQSTPNVGFSLSSEGIPPSSIPGLPKRRFRDPASSLPGEKTPPEKLAQPAVEEPAVEEPAVEEPAVEEPVAQKTSVETEPVTEETVVLEPAEPVMEEPPVETEPVKSSNKNPSSKEHKAEILASNETKSKEGNLFEDTEETVGQPKDNADATDEEDKEGEDEEKNEDDDEDTEDDVDKKDDDGDDDDDDDSGGNAPCLAEVHQSKDDKQPSVPHKNVSKGDHGEGIQEDAAAQKKNEWRLADDISDVDPEHMAEEEFGEPNNHTADNDALNDSYIGENGRNEDANENEDGNSAEDEETDKMEVDEIWADEN